MQLIEGGRWPLNEVDGINLAAMNNEEGEEVHHEYQSLRRHVERDFFLVALLHLLRLVWQWDMKIDGWHVPDWASVLAIVVAGFLSFAGFRIYRQGRWLSWFR